MPRPMMKKYRKWTEIERISDLWLWYTWTYTPGTKSAMFESAYDMKAYGVIRGDQLALGATDDEVCEWFWAHIAPKESMPAIAIYRLTKLPGE